MGRLKQILSEEHQFRIGQPAQNQLSRNYLPCAVLRQIDNSTVQYYQTIGSMKMATKSMAAVAALCILLQFYYGSGMPFSAEEPDAEDEEPDPTEEESPGEVDQGQAEEELVPADEDEDEEEVEPTEEEPETKQDDEETLEPTEQDTGPTEEGPQGADSQLLNSRVKSTLKVNKSLA